MYVLSNDSIKTNDYVIQDNMVLIVKFDRPILFPINGGRGYNFVDGKKIIASTNKKLNLPNLTQNYINDFINNNLKYDTVLVDYEYITSNILVPKYVNNVLTLYPYKIKTNDEIKELLYEAFKAGSHYKSSAISYGTTKERFDKIVEKWIKENYK